MYTHIIEKYHCDGYRDPEVAHRDHEVHCGHVQFVFASPRGGFRHLEDDTSIIVTFRGMSIDRLVQAQGS